jgi:2-dehydro-3-deoxyphosphogluconate aldolase/(4S)-4-hydroxy-2-oxoglutarate aldolase
VGGQLIEPKAVAARDFARITALAKQFVEIVQKHRNG